MAEATYKHHGHDLRFSDSDVINPDDWIPANEYNPHQVRPFLFLDHGFTAGVAFADCLQDAFDTLADSGKIDGMKIGPAEMSDYPEGEGISYLGNASEPFDVESLTVVELPNPARLSFVAQFAAAFPAK